MMTIVFTTALITGLVLAVKFWRMRGKERTQGTLPEKETILCGNGIIASKEYFLMKGIIKY